MSSETPLYSERLDRAVALALSAFRNIDRKASGVPYMTHLLQVMVTVGEHGGDEDQMIAAVLHDYLEDIDGSSEEELARDFGERVATLVVALSDTVVRPKPPWKARKVAYIELLTNKDVDVKLISAADKLHNARSIVRDQGRLGDAVFDRFTGTKEQTLWYYREVLRALRVGFEHPILAELEHAVKKMHQRAKVALP